DGEGPAGVALGVHRSLLGVVGSLPVLPNGSHSQPTGVHHRVPKRGGPTLVVASGRGGPLKIEDDQPEVTIKSLAWARGCSVRVRWVVVDPKPRGQRVGMAPGLVMPVARTRG